MMREIKFRGRNIITGEWVYGAYIFFKSQNEHIITHFESDSGVRDGHLFIKGFYPVAEVVNPETVGQFTGLYDNDGDDIYEGDILKRSFLPNFKVVFSKSLSAFLGVNIKGCNTTLLSDYTGSCYGIKIAGNVYENPELLEVIK